MALKKSITALNNFQEQQTFDNAYIKVHKISGGKEGMQVVALTYKSEGSDVVIKTTKFDFVPALNGVNFIAQAYDYMKEMPEFADAKDC